MDTGMLIVLFRGIERVLITAAAAFCIWLGYRLFQSLPTVQDANGSLDLPSIKLTLSKVGPGVFFGLFGALVLWEAVRTTVLVPLRVDAAPAAGTAAAPPPSAIMGLGSGGAQALRHVRVDIEVLNCLAENPSAGLDPQVVASAVHKAKVALLGPVWPAAWGEAAFAELERGGIPASGPIAEIMGARHQSCPGERR